MQRLSIHIPNTAGPQEPRQISLAGQNQVRVLHLRLPRLEEHQTTLREVSQHDEDLQMLVRRDV